MGSLDEAKFTLPLIDFGPFLSGTSSQKRATADAITNGFKTAGFIYLKNFGIESSLVQQVFSSSASLFSLPQSEKDLLECVDPTVNRGYIARGREKLSEEIDGPISTADVSDIKESFEIGRDGADLPPNLWPPEDEFKTIMCQFFEKGQNLHAQVMGAIAIGLGLDERFFDKYIDSGDNSLRLLHYPSVARDVFTNNSKQVRAGAHTDYGDITILFQDDRGGLQVKAPNGSFIDATPISDTVVINAGDLLARWSNDVIKSTLHRVVEPPVRQGTEYPARYSIAYFAQPNFDAWIEGIPGTVAKGEANKYEPVQSGRYLTKRLAATHVY